MADQGERRVIRTWLRFDDVECARCKKWCGPEGDTVYVVGDEGCVCTDCVTDTEREEATSG